MSEELETPLVYGAIKTNVYRVLEEYNFLRDFLISGFYILKLDLFDGELIFDLKHKYTEEEISVYFTLDIRILRDWDYSVLDALKNPDIIVAVSYTEFSNNTHRKKVYDRNLNSAITADGNMLYKILRELYSIQLKDYDKSYRFRFL